MKRLRHPIRAISEPFGKAGLIVAVFALVFAMLGGAYAATGGNGGKQIAIASKKKHKKAKAKRGPRGKRGKRGPAGPAGPAGPVGPVGPVGPAGATGATGPKGATGATGEKGERGEQGEDGEAGTSVTASTEAPGSNCEEGGSKFVTGSTTTYACNGKEGPQGPPGQTGFAAELPEGATETGVWNTIYFHGAYPANTQSYVTLSFPFRLAEGEAPRFEFVEAESLPTAECPGSATNPEAAEGYLCVYQAAKEEKLKLIGNLNPETNKSLPTAGRSGFAFAFYEPTSSEGKATRTGGTWAVTSKKTTP